MNDTSLALMRVDASPRDHGYPPSLWSRDLVRALVVERFRMALSGPAATRLLRRLGIALRGLQDDLPPDPPPRRPATGVARGGDEVVEELVHLGAATARGRDADHWCPAQAPHAAPGPVGVLSAAVALGCVRFSVTSGPLVAATVVRFLGRLSADAAEPLVVVSDEAVYDSPELGAYVESTRGRVRLHRGRLPQEGLR